MPHTTVQVPALTGLVLEVAAQALAFEAKVIKVVLLLKPPFPWIRRLKPLLQPTSP